MICMKNLIHHIYDKASLEALYFDSNQNCFLHASNPMSVSTGENLSVY